MLINVWCSNHSLSTVGKLGGVTNNESVKSMSSLSQSCSKEYVRPSTPIAKEDSSPSCGLGGVASLSSVVGGGDGGGFSVGGGEGT